VLGSREKGKNAKPAATMQKKVKEKKKSTHHRKKGSNRNLHFKGKKKKKSPGPNARSTGARNKKRERDRRIDKRGGNEKGCPSRKTRGCCESRCGKCAKGGSIIQKTKDGFARTVGTAWAKKALINEKTTREKQSQRTTPSVCFYKTGW